MFKFVFDRQYFKFEEVFPYKAYYATPCCGAIVEAADKVELMKTGRWIATATRPGAHPSYHFDALTSPFVPWEKIAERFVKTAGDPLKLKTFWNPDAGPALRGQGRRARPRKADAAPRQGP
jgi:phage terminase large subunit GpA-like protein